MSDVPPNNQAATPDPAPVPSKAAEFRSHRTFSRLVLLGLAAPLIALAVVLWALLPGGVAGISYTPSDYSQVVQLHPYDWTTRTVSITGYLDTLCTVTKRAPVCDRWVLLDQRTTAAIDDQHARALLALQVLPQKESGLYTFFRHFIPGMNKPFPQGSHIGDSVTVTGSLGTANTATGVPIFVPRSR